MILTVDGNTRIKAVLRRYPCSIFFMKEELKENIENILKKFKILPFCCLVEM
jgi:hypothetical protein